MKDLVIGLFLGFCVGICAYYLVDGSKNYAARALTAQQQREAQSQLSVIRQMCPEVLQKMQAAEAKK